MQAGGGGVVGAPIPRGSGVRKWCSCDTALVKWQPEDPSGLGFRAAKRPERDTKVGNRTPVIYSSERSACHGDHFKTYVFGRGRSYGLF